MAQNRLQRIDAIVLRTVPFSETSLIGSLFTRQLGRLSAIARGARRPGNVAAAAFQPTNEVSCTVYLGSRTGLRTVTELETVTTHDSIARSPELLGLAGYACELIITQLPEEEPSPGVYSLLKGFLAALEASRGMDAERALVAFEFRLQKALGYGLRTDACIRCGGTVGTSPVLSVGSGGLICHSCDPQEACLEALSREDLLALRAMLTEPFAHWKRQIASRETVITLARIARRVWEVHAPVPTRSKSLLFLAEVRTAVYRGDGANESVPEPMAQARPLPP